MTLWTPSPDEALLRADFDHFVTRFFRLGRAAAITGHHGQVLQVRPKGRNAADVRRAYGPSGEPVEIGKCGFYLPSRLRGSYPPVAADPLNASHCESTPLHVDEKIHA